MNFGANIEATDKDGRTVLHYAAASGSVNMIQTLLHFHARYGAIDKVM
jgi:ankyrin repeat protein